MKYISLSLNDIEKESNELYKKINKDYNYDLVVFIAKGSYIIGENFAEFNHVPLLEIFATRSGGKIKRILKPILKLFPTTILMKLREKEVKSNYHEKKKDRKVSFDEKTFSNYKKCKRILLVDDSIDTGYSAKLTKEVLQNYFNESEIRVASYNVMSKSMFYPDYYIYEDAMISGPWSSDSKENSQYIAMYNNWKSNFK